MQIRSEDWTLPPSFLDSVQTCEQGHEAKVVKFGVRGGGHDGFQDGHGPVDDEQPGRAYIRPNRADQLVFVWEIAGWEHVESAEIFVFAHGQDRPIAFETVSAASGTIETWGTTAGVRLTSAQLQVIPNDVYTFGGGPYLARLRIAKVKPNTRVTVGALRSYFDVLPMAVIGGGFAGVRAAATLLEKGNNESVLLLEALDRLGGRACTVPWNGLPIDLGCQFLQDASTNPLVTLAGTLGQEVFWHDQEEIILSGGEDVQEQETWMAASGIATDTESVTEDISLQAAVGRVVAKKAATAVFDDHEAAGTAAAKKAGLTISDHYTAFCQFGAEWATTNHGEAVRTRIEEMTGNPFLRLALALLADLDEATEPDNCTKWEEEEEKEKTKEKAVGDGDGGDGSRSGDDGSQSGDDGSQSGDDDSGAGESNGRNKMAVAGFGTLLQAYVTRTFDPAQGDCTIRTRVAVQRLVCTDRFIRIVTDQGTFYAAGAIVSVSTEIIRGGHIAFDPVLPQTLQDAFGWLPLGHYKKIFLPVISDSPLDKFLRSHQDEATEQPASESTQEDLSFMTLDQNELPWKFLFRLSLGLVVAFVGGNLARRLDARSTAEAAEAALGALAFMTQLSRDEVHASWTGESTTSRWSEEPYFLGAYSYTRPGGVTANARSTLRDAVVNTRIVFAGEAMRVAKHEFATAHGAWLSGEYAAKKLLGLRL